MIPLNSNTSFRTYNNRNKSICQVLKKRPIYIDESSARKTTILRTIGNLYIQSLMTHKLNIQHYERSRWYTTTTNPDCSIAQRLKKINGRILQKMKFLSICEFKGLCNNISPNEFIILSDNQSQDMSELGVTYNLIFNSIAIYTNPNSICFKSQNDSYIKFDRIKHIIKHNDSLLGSVFEIVCNGFINPSSEFSYTVIIR